MLKGFLESFLSEKQIWLPKYQFYSMFFVGEEVARVLGYTRGLLILEHCNSNDDPNDSVLRSVSSYRAQ